MISLKGINYQYPGNSIQIFDDLTLDIEQGEVLIITGDNGSGKTTLLKQIAGIIPKFTGGIFSGVRQFEGVDYDLVDISRFGVSLLGEEQQFIQSRVDQEILYILECQNQGEKIVWEKFKEIADDFKIEHLLTKKTQSLSSGEAQIVKLALAFLHRPRVVLMDEPLSYLDEGNREKTLCVLKDLKQKHGLTYVIADYDETVWKNWYPNIKTIHLSSKGAAAPSVQNKIVFQNKVIGNSVLEFNDVEFSYGNQKIVDQFNKTVKEGECVVITGPNGSGKTTVLKLIMKILKPDSGKMFKKSNVKTRMMSTPVYQNFFSLKIREEIAVSGEVKEKYEIFDSTNIDHRYVFDLSQGEQQKLGLEIFFDPETRLLLLDEPFLHLDEISKQKTVTMIQNLSKTGCTIIVTTHEPEILQSVVDQVWNLEKI